MCIRDRYIAVTMPETQRDPVRNILRGCSSCGGVGTKVSVPKGSNISKEIRAFYESEKGYKCGSGKVVVEYEHVAGECVHCNGEKCEKCYFTGKNIRFIKQLPYKRLLSGTAEKVLSFLLGALIALGWYLWF